MIEPNAVRMSTGQRFKALDDHREVYGFGPLRESGGGQRRPTVVGTHFVFGLYPDGKIRPAPIEDVQRLKVIKPRVIGPSVG